MHLKRQHSSKALIAPLGPSAVLAGREGRFHEITGTESVSKKLKKKYPPCCPNYTWYLPQSAQI